MSAKSRQKEAIPPIGDRLLTLHEAADVLRLSTRTVREYAQRGEIEGRIIGGRWRFRLQTWTPSLRTRPVTGTSLEKTVTGIRRWSSENKGVHRAGVFLAFGQGSTARTCRSYPHLLCEPISRIRAKSPTC
jgi:excisionase family DNA binding protein